MSEVERKINKQTLFYFSHDYIVKILREAVDDQLPAGIEFSSGRITAGLQSGSGLTLCLQRSLSEHSK